ncbi:protein FAR1-RELATED SEQUENCE 3-like, partial [Trifolium medium]|nr:protein FAR1-RELATED SEQUENCE 3-like [Trifolium medium]
MQDIMLEDAQASGESEVKFQVSRDALGAVLRSMAYIREQLSGA